MTQRNRETLLALVALQEALTPSLWTKTAYIGEFSFSLDREDEVGAFYEERIDVPWTTIKEIMAAIRARATLDPTGEKA